METAESSFDLFLRLIDDGTLDNARASAVNGTFWLIVYGLGEKHPEWIPEIAAHWLLRFRRFSKYREKSGKNGTGELRLV